MLLIIQYIFFSIIIVFLIDKIYNFVQNNNGIHNKMSRQEFMDKETNRINNDKNNSQLSNRITSNVEDKINKNTTLSLNDQIIMERELNKIFSTKDDVTDVISSNISSNSSSNDNSLNGIHSDNSIDNHKLIETSNIFELPISS